MSESNSTVERQIRPTELQEQLGIKKDAYYAYLKHLGIRAEKDSGKAFLTEIQADQIKKLRQHVVDGGKIEDFVMEESTALAMAESGELGQVEPEEADPTEGLDMELLYREDSELAAHR